MSDTTPAAFDPKPRQVKAVLNMIAGEAILAGDVVAFASTGVDDTVMKALSSIGSPLGVALYSQATVGGKIAVACAGSILMVKEGAGSDILAGTGLMTYTVAGTVVGATVAADAQVIGFAISKIAANSTGYAQIDYTFVGKGA